MFGLFKKKQEVQETKKRETPFLSDDKLSKKQIEITNALIENNFRVKANAHAMGAGMDSALIKNAYSFTSGYGINPVVMQYFAEQSFIGYQTCSILAQNALISKCCLLPAKDAIRNGWKVTFNTEEEVDTKVHDRIRDLDKDFNVNKQLVELSYFNKVYGIRIAYFDIQSTDPEFYEKPFNLDGITKGSYKGIKQIDPIWCTPQLSTTGATDPTSKDFYEPVYWIINGKKIHKSHLVVVKGAEVSDLLKPTYNYGGIPLTQKLFLRVYASERTANEVPMLVQTKRLNVKKTDLSQAMSNIEAFQESLATSVRLRDNYGMYAIDTEEDIIQLETSLAEIDTAIMTQYQLVASIAQIPVTKLMGTQLKGFSSGEGETQNYHEELENEQSYIMTPLLNRHYDLLMRSYIEPEFGINENCTIVWNPVSTMTAKEKAEIQEIKARTDVSLAQSGAISGYEIQQRIIQDPDSGYSGISLEDFEPDLNLAMDEIRKEDGLYYVYSESGERLSRGFQTEESAKSRLREIEYFKSTDECLDELCEDVEDSEYQGKKVELNKPFRDSEGGKKFAVYVKNDKGNIVKVRFGDENMEIKRDDPDARANFRARHDCENKTDKTTAGYWSCKFWSTKSVSELLNG